ncbi:MAG: amidohydrolase [Actinomycetota bacterium]
MYTGDATRSWAQALAVTDGQIAAIGSHDEIGDLVGASTEVVDLAQGMLVPGFQDAHVHPVSSGMEMLLCDLTDLSTKQEYLSTIRDYAAAGTDGSWILGGGWSQDAFPRGCPSKDDLDAVVPDRPILLTNRDGHSAWVNSMALEMADVHGGTPDPPDGRIERLVDGEPQGTLHEGAIELVNRLVPPVERSFILEGLRRGQAHLHSLGITAWQDADVAVDEVNGGNYEAYVAAGEAGELTARVVGALWWDRHRELDQIDDLLELREKAPVTRFAPTSVKVMLDGVCETFTAAVLDPYLDVSGNPTENRGISFIDPDLLKEAVTRLDAEGFQVHFHALAERAVREALDAVEAARTTNGMSDARHHLAHLQVVHPDDLPRFRTLGAVANAQPLWAAHESQMDELTIPFLGEPRWTWQYPFASLLRHGATLAMGSDWSVSTADPLAEMHVAVNRRMPSDYPHRVETDEVFLPEERLDLATALAGFTMGSAYVNHLDKETGSIEVGKRADLAVIDRNLFEHPADEISSARCQQTFVDGVRVHAAPDA